MAESLPEFLARFVVPLHEGGPIEVGAPLGVRDRERMSAEADALYDPQLRGLRLQRATELLPDPSLPDPDVSDLSLWLGLHNLLALDHPDRDRVWARASTWAMAVDSTRALIHYAAPTDASEQLARHLSIDRFLDLIRVDQIARVEDQSRRFEGQPAPRAVRRMASIGELDLSEERVRWITAKHTDAVESLLPELMFVSPLTALLRPRRVLGAFDPRFPARWLRTRAGARAIVHTWAREDDWVGVGAALVGHLLRALGREDLLEGDLAPGGAATRPASAPHDADEPADDEARALAAAPALALSAASDHGPAEHAALLGALIHLHLLKVLAFEARVSLGGRADRAAARAFLALPLMLPQLQAVLGDPLVGIDDDDALRRWEDYLAHLRGLVPLDVMENLVAALAEPVVQEDAA